MLGLGLGSIALPFNGPDCKAKAKAGKKLCVIAVT